MVDLIKKKRDGLELSRKEYDSIIKGFTAGEIPDYQLAAFLMAVYFQGMSTQETAILTDIMMRSGELVDLSEIDGIKVDKHSTGGVGDKTTLVLAPLVASAGVPVAKMSGRGLGHTGGTIDKLESIQGLSIDMSRQLFIERIKKHGIAICGQNESLVPADKKIYALRDVTGTVDNISLIASSIMSKKLACGADAIVIDIKVGEGAYMKNEEEATALAKILIEIGNSMDRKVIAVISAMHEPLGYAVGNALEVKEAIDTLKGGGPEDLKSLCLTLGSYMLVAGKKANNSKEGIKILENLITSGAAFEKFKELIEVQGGDTSVIEQTSLLPVTQFSQPYRSPQTGYICELNALNVGLASMSLGAGRATKLSKIDYGAGIILKKKVGDYVEKGEVLTTLFSNNRTSFEKAKTYLEQAYKMSKAAPAYKPLILKVIE